jgi:subtilisin family serine protease
MAGRRAHPALPALLAIAAVVALAACRPITRPPSPAPPTATACATESTPEEQPTASKPLQYSAVVDPTGPAGPQVEAFVAASPAEKQRHVHELDDTGDVLAVDVAKPVHTLTVDPSDDPRYAVTQEQKLALDHLGFPAAWAQADGTGVKIAVIDSGVEATHPDLAGKVTTPHDFYPGQPLFYHGTHVAGIAAALDNHDVGGIGGAPGASLLSYRVLDRNGSGSSTNVAKAIIEAVYPGGAQVINLSLGGGPDRAMQSAIRFATQHGVVVVAAAGNNGNTCPVYPAAYPEAIAVAALRTGTNVRAGFSNYGSYVDVAAPGDPIDSTCLHCVLPPGDQYYAKLRGTSMATPFVSAVAALVESKCHYAGPSAGTAIRSRVESTALYLAPYQSGLGHGRVRADQAVTAC